jgi:hypothetical protein
MINQAIRPLFVYIVSFILLFSQSGCRRTMHDEEGSGSLSEESEKVEFSEEILASYGISMEFSEEILASYGISTKQSRTRHIDTSSNEKQLTREGLHDALVEGWEKALDAFIENGGNPEAEILIVNSLTQTGGLSIFPASGSYEDEDLSEPIFKVYLSLYCWAEEYDELPYFEDPTEEEDRIFNQAYERMIDGKKKALVEAIEDSRVFESFRKLRANPKFTIYWVDEEFAYIRDQMEFLWGNIPEPLRFSSGIQLIEHTFKKASLYPKIKSSVDGRVKAIHWKGMDFDDSYVNILKDHPGVSDMLKDLEHFVITATQITETGIADLKKLFPGVSFTVTSWEDYIQEYRDPWHDNRMWEQ